MARSRTCADADDKDRHNHAKVNMAIDTHIYYLPFYFQAVQSTSVQGSGTRLLPYLISVFSTALATGILITTFGYYVPLMWLGAALLTIGCGLIQTLHVGSPTADWFGYQVLTGIGFGMAFQIPYTAVQVVLPAEDLPMGNALVVFFQALGGALAISIGQNVLSSSLHSQLAQIPQVDPKQVITDGATRIVSRVVPKLRRVAYSVALSRTLPPLHRPSPYHYHNTYFFTTSMKSTNHSFRQLWAKSMMAYSNSTSVLCAPT
ncbi:MAG: hypothetical protein Q9172_003489 [Xanthocarpia lactea]